MIVGTKALREDLHVDPTLQLKAALGHRGDVGGSCLKDAQERARGRELMRERQGEEISGHCSDRREECIGGGKSEGEVPVATLRKGSDVFAPPEDQLLRRKLRARVLRKQPPNCPCRWYVRSVRSGTCA